MIVIVISSRLIAGSIVTFLPSAPEHATSGDVFAYEQPPTQPQNRNHFHYPNIEYGGQLKQCGRPPSMSSGGRSHKATILAASARRQCVTICRQIASSHRKIGERNSDFGDGIRRSQNCLTTRS